MKPHRGVISRAGIWLSLVSLLGNGMFPAAAMAGTDALQQTGDVLQIALPLTALGTTFFAGNPDGDRWDRQGTKQMLFSWGSSMATTHLLKVLVGKQRPTGDAETSYPSGHTASAWSGAAFIATRYGGVWGWLAYGGALVTGYSRVASDQHYAGDVVASASLAQIWNWVFVTPHDARLQPPGSPPRPPRWHFAYAAAPAFLISNRFSAPATGGDTFDLNSLAGEGDPTATGEASLTLRLGGRNELLALIQPMDSRDQGVLDAPLYFDGLFFPAGTQIQTRWELYDLRLGWRNALVNSDRWKVLLGAGLCYQNTSLEMETEDQSMKASVEASGWLPYGHADLVWKFVSRWQLAARGSAGVLGSDWMLDAAGGLRFTLNTGWDLGAGYRYYARSLETTDVDNRTEYQMPYLEIGHNW